MAKKRKESKQLILQLSKMLMTNYGYQYKELHFDLRTLTKFIGDNFYDQMLSRCRLESFNASVWLLQCDSPRVLNPFFDMYNMSYGWPQCSANNRWRPHYIYIFKFLQKSLAMLA